MTKTLIDAAQKFDWGQVALNGGPPCFHLENGKFCGRAERWSGHGETHQFVSLANLLTPQPTALPKIMGRLITRAEVIEGLRIAYAGACENEKRKDDTFVRWPDMETILNHIEQHGLEPR